MGIIVTLGAQNSDYNLNTTLSKQYSKENRLSFDYKFLGNYKTVRGCKNNTIKHTQTQETTQKKSIILRKIQF